MKENYERLIEAYLLTLLEELPAIAIDGLKGIGKSFTSKRLVNTIFELDKDKDFELLNSDINLLLEKQKPILIDEWQYLPKVWDFVRRAVDNETQNGSYLLTGSIANTNEKIHSGAGRIVRLKMFPLSLAERNREQTTVSLKSLLSSQSPFSTDIFGSTEATLRDYVKEIIVSGLPNVRQYHSELRQLMFASYFENILSHDFEQQGVRIRQPQTLMRWLKSFAAATGTFAGYNEILDSSTGGEGNKPSAKTTISYREALENLWLIEELPYWIDGEEYFSSLKKTPKHYLADPALSAYLLGLNEEILLATSVTKTTLKFENKYGSILGRLFESLIKLSLNTYAGVNNAVISFLATSGGEHEIDFIIQKGKAIIAVEVKLASAVTDSDVRHLVWLKEKMQDKLLDALIITTGSVAYRRDDGIAVVPAFLLGA